MISVAIHASLRCVSWKPATGLPNMIRCWLYRRASSKTHCARPMTPMRCRSGPGSGSMSGAFKPWAAGRMASAFSSTSWKIELRGHGRA